MGQPLIKATSQYEGSFPTPFEMMVNDAEARIVEIDERTGHMTLQLTDLGIQRLAEEGEITLLEPLPDLTIL